MLVQLERQGQIVNVYVEQMQGKLLDSLGREDIEYIRTEITHCVGTLIEKFHKMYGEKK